MRKTGAVIVAAGKGSRMKTAESKQYLPLQGKPVFIHTLEVISSISEIGEMILVVGRGEVDKAKLHLREHDTVPTGRVTIVEGGSERQHSVYEGIRRLAGLGDNETVLVHDAVRPFVRRQDILRCLEAAKEFGAAVLAVPVKDTIKIVNTDGVIDSTPDRRSLWAIQTPQAFRLSLLMDAYIKARQEGFVGTDDSMLVERAGGAVHVVEGDYSNIKLTTPEDLTWAEWLLERGRLK